MRKPGFTCDKCGKTANSNPYIYVPFIRYDDKKTISAEKLPKWMKMIGEMKYCKSCAERIAFFILEERNDL